MNRIAIIVPGGAAEYGKGIHIPAVYDLVSRLSEQFEITLYSLSVPGVKQPSLSCGKARVRYLRTHTKSAFVVKFLSFLSVLLRDFRTEQFQLLHGMLGWPAEAAVVLASRLLRIPSLITLHGGETANIPQFQYGSLRHPLLKKLTFWIGGSASSLVVLSKFQEARLKQLGLFRNDVHIIPHCPDSLTFHPKVKLLKEPFHFLHVANVHELKDQITLLKAFSIIRKEFECKLRIVGLDYLNGRLRGIAEQLDISDSVEFVGYVENKALGAHFNWGHVLLHTSLYEAQSVAVAEAAACGLAIAGTKVGLISDFSPTGAIGVDVGDHERLAREVIHLLKDPVRFDGLRAESLEWAKIHNLEWTVGQYTALYQKLVGKHLQEKHNRAVVHPFLF